MKKTICAFLALILAFGLLSGCSGSSSGADEQRGTSTSGMSSASSAAKTGETTDLLLWLPPFGTGDALDKEFWEKTLQPWAAENNVNLSIEITPWSNYEEKYMTGFSSGAGPDVGYMYLEMLNDFIEMGTLEPMDDMFTQAEKDNYLHFDLGFINGKQYTVPFVVGNARIMYFNTDILEQAGVTELPKTWDDFVEVCTQIKDANIEGVIPFAQEWAAPAIGALNNIYYPFFWQAGGELYSGDGTTFTLGEGDAGTRAAQFLYDLKTVYGILPEDTVSLQEGDLVNMYKEGRIGAAIMGTNRAVELDDAGVNWDFVPSLTDEREAIWVAADALILNSASQNKEKAVELIKYITSPDVMVSFHTEIAPFPPISKDEPYVDNPRFEEMYNNGSAIMHTLPVASNSYSVVDTLYKNLQLMMLGDLTPEQAIQKTVEYADSV